MDNKANNQFLIALDGLELSGKQRANIQTGIQSVVMSELAKMDNLESYSVGKKKFDAQMAVRPPDFIYGMWWDELKKSINFSRNESER
jgi:hypothetical protein